MGTDEALLAAVIGGVCGGIFSLAAGQLQALRLRKQIEQAGFKGLIDAVGDEGLTFDDENKKHVFTRSWLSQQKEPLSYTEFNALKSEDHKRALIRVLMAHDRVAAALLHGGLRGGHVISFQGDVIWLSWYILEPVVCEVRKRGEWSPFFVNYLERFVNCERFKNGMRRFLLRRRRSDSSTFPNGVPEPWRELYKHCGLKAPSAISPGQEHN